MAQVQVAVADRQIIAPEESLVEAAAAGAQGAFAEIYQLHLSRIFRYLYYRTGHRQTAEDLTEQVFLKAWQAMPRYKSSGTPFVAWLFRIAHNLAVDHHRNKRETLALDELLEIEDKSPTAQQLLERREEASKLSAALAQLSRLEQSVIALRFVERLDHRTVATIIQKSETATRSIQSRALARLAQLLGSESGE